MPIDRELLRNQAEGQINDLLSTRSTEIGRSLAQTRGQIEAKRPILNKVSPFASALTGGGPVPEAGIATSLTANKLGQQLDQKFAQQRFGMESDRLNLIYQNALRRVGSATTNRAEAEQFARQEVQNQIRRDFQAGEAGKDRASKERQLGISEGFNNQSVMMQQQMQDQASGDIYQQAMMRSLFGLGGAVGTGYALNKYYGNKPVSTNTGIFNPAPSQTDLPYGPSPNWGVNPQRPTGGY